MWLLDGTFKTCPLLFHQLFTIHGVKEKKSIPLVFALLSHKTQSIYEHLFKEIVGLQDGLNPKYIMSDFEMACNFEDTYIGRPDVRQLSGRRIPRFAILDWKMYESVVMDMPRTNNSVEGWHTKFSKLVSITHPPPMHSSKNYN